MPPQERSPHAHPHPSRELIDAQIKSMVAQRGRLYELLYALVEECYRQSAADWQRGEWQQLARVLTTAEIIAERIDLGVH